MVTSNDSAPSDETIQRYQAEMQLVRAELQTMITALDMPLRLLVQARVNALRPEVRAAIVLAAGVTGVSDAGESRDDSDGGRSTEEELLRTHRVYLAAALEMLSVALAIHKLLLADEPRDLDKSILGGTILAGDYCFSRSAAMAVKTDSPEVVKLFSDALKSVSEGSLRHLFALEPGRSVSEATSEAEKGRQRVHFDDDLELFHAGVVAATVLTGRPVDSVKPALHFVTQLAGALHAQPDAPPTNVKELYALTVDLPASQRKRWRHLLAWLLDRKPGHKDDAQAIL